MPSIAGQPHYEPFYTGATGRTIANFQVKVFTINFQPVDAATSSSLQITEVGNGYYYATYTPSAAGFYYLGLFDTTDSVAVAKGADILAADAVSNVTQNTGGTNALQVTQVSDPQDFLLFLFNASDWQVGNTNPQFAVASTQLDSGGNWLSQPLVVTPGTYVVVIQNNFGTIIVTNESLTV